VARPSPSAAADEDRIGRSPSAVTNHQNVNCEGGYP
jgi:hypothetical protein